MWEKLRVKRVEEKLLIPSDCLRKSERSKKIDSQINFPSEVMSEELDSFCKY